MIDLGDTENIKLMKQPVYFLSLIIPAYNEEMRILSMLKETCDFLKKKSALNNEFTYEIIVVDDGSRDNTLGVVREYSNTIGIDIKVLKLGFNCGKGYCVKLGTLIAQGNYVIFADADGATDIHAMNDLLAEIENVKQREYGIAVGSRNHMRNDIKRERSSIRSFLNKCQVLMVKVLCGTHVNDTQCGFKLFTRRAALELFLPMHLQRWAFDVELLYLARQLNIPVIEVPVPWHEVPGSRLNILFDSMKMARDILAVRLLYTLGLWKTSDYSM